MRRLRLPYIDNAKAVLITLAINLAVIFLFNWPNGVAYADVMLDSLVCAVITVAIDMWIVYSRLKRMRARGEMPPQVRESGFMQRLPQNPVLLGVVYAVVFAVLTVGCNAAILGFYGIRHMAFAPWMVYKLIYATALSVIVVEYSIFRFIQPDWACQNGGAAADSQKTILDKPPRNPLPKIGVFKAMYGAVTGNIAMNIIIGSLLGGVVVEADASTVIRPTTVEGIPITGLVFGFIVGVLVTNGIVTASNEIIVASGRGMLEGAVLDRRVAWMPRKKLPLICLVCFSVMVFSAVALPSIMRLFDLSRMNFYQFTIFISIYAALLSMPLSSVLTRRCMQPDYIKYILSRHKML